MRYQTYPKYSEAQDKWLGEIPVHWLEVRTDFKTESTKKPVSENKLMGEVIFHYSIPNVQDYGTGAFEQGDDIDSSKLLITEKQLLVSKLNPRKGTVCIAEPVLETLTVASGEFVPLVSNELDVRYTYYTWLSDKVVKLLSSRVQSVTKSHQRVNPEDITKMNWAWPPFEEQKKIAGFLDYKTQQIEPLIEKKKALIEKLNEQRIAVITQAVTKGLNKNAKMKPSGVDWLGNVPEHWEIMQFKDRCRVVSGQVDPTLPEYEELPLIAPDHIEKGSGRLFETQTAKEQGAISGKYIFEKGDLLYSKIRPELNKLCIAPSQGLCSADMYAIRVENDFLIDFLFYLMLSKYFHQYAILESMRVAMPKINRDALGQFKILVPPVNEQVKIVGKIKTALEKIRNNIDISNRSILILEEYKSTLITDAVTGKIDVRDFDVEKDVT